MKRILVCFTVANDLDDVMRRDWENASLEHLDIGYTVEKLNGDDEAALEYALRMKDEAARQGDAAAVCAVTLGSHLKEQIYRGLYAVGVDRVVLLRPPGPMRFQPGRTARLLADFAAPEMPDLVLTGQRGSLGGSGCTPALLAHRLGLPWVGNAADLCPDETGLRVAVRARGCTLEAVLKGPAVVSLSNARHPYLRVATLREKLAAGGRALETTEVAAAPSEGDELTPVRLYHQPVLRACRFAAGDTPKRQAAALLGLLEGKV